MLFLALSPTQAFAWQHSPLVSVEAATVCKTTYTRAQFHAAARSTYRHPVVPSAKRATLHRIVKCQRRAVSRRIVRRSLRRYKAKHRQMVAMYRLTPFLGPNGTRWAIPWAIVSCESRGNFRAYNGVLGAGGAYQIIPGTWAAHGGRAFAPVANMSSPYGQHVVASRIWAGGTGRGQWAC